MEGLRVRQTKGKGRGVYATRVFEPGEVIERCPVLRFAAREVKPAMKTILAAYLFHWEDEDQRCLPLGYGAIYNHSYTPNARYYFQHTRGLLVVKAIKRIRPGTEVTFNYNFVPDCLDPLEVPDARTGKLLVVQPPAKALRAR